MAVCSVGECERKAHCRGWCKRHYEMQRRYGRLESLTDADRFFSKVEFGPKQDDGTRCLLWIAGTSGGYGRFSVGGRLRMAHRWLYERWVGPVEGGLDLHHAVCETPACVNPAHMEQLTKTEHISGHRAARPLTVVCKHGHSMADEDNIYWHNGHQHCRACRHTHSVKQAAARKAARHLAKS